MTMKQIVALVVGIVALGVTAWKGPSTWGLISTGVTALAILVGTLGIVPKKDEEYIRDLEDALRLATEPQNTVDNSGLVGPSRVRFMEALNRRSGIS